MKSFRNYFDYIVVGTGLSSYPAVYELLKKKKILQCLMLVLI
jgi:hypothetical protein